jgi:hypothetical protein
MTTKNNIIELTKKHNFLQKMFINFFENNNDSYEYIENTFNKITKYKEIIKNYNIDVLSFETLELLNDEITKSIQDSQSKTMAKKLLSKKSQNLLSKDAYFLFGILLNNGISESQIRDDFTKKIAAHSNIDSYEFKTLLRNYVENKTSNSIEKVKEKARNYRTNIISEKDNILILSINDYRACKELGSQSWCIAYSKSTFYNYRIKQLNKYFVADKLFESSEYINDAIGNRFYFVYNFNYGIEDKRRLTGLTVSPSGKAIYAHYMNDSTVDDDTIDSYMKLISFKDILDDFKWNLKTYITQKPLEVLQMSMAFNIKSTYGLLETIDEEIPFEMLKYISDPNELTIDIFNELFKRIDVKKKYKYSRYGSEKTREILLLLLTSKYFLKYDEDKILAILNMFDHVDFGDIITDFYDSSSNRLISKIDRQNKINSVYRNLLYYVKKANITNFTCNTRIFQNIATYNHKKIPYIISKMKYSEITSLFNATNISSLIKSLSLGTNPFDELTGKIEEYNIDVNLLGIEKALNMKSVLTASKNLKKDNFQDFFNCKIFKDFFEHSYWRTVNGYKQTYKLQSSIEFSDNSDDLKKKLMLGDRSEIKITSHNVSIKILELYIKDKEFCSWYDIEPFYFKFNNQKLFEYLINTKENFLIKFLSSNMFNELIGEEILFPLMKYLSFHESKSKYLLKCLDKSTCKLEQPLFDFGFSFNSDMVMSYLKNKRADFKKLMISSTVKEIKFLNLYLEEA